VYAGIDPMAGKRIRLTETIPPGPRAAVDAEKARTRLLAQVHQRRAPRTRATVNELMDRHLQHADVERTTLVRYESCVRVHVRPPLGDLDSSRLDGDVLDSFFATLRRCRTHCNGRNRGIEHRTGREHDCDARCRPQW
jgi:integrase